MMIKEELYNACLKFIDNRLLTVKSTISDIQNSLQSETKSSAGDKHETGRAMLQLEREKAGHQLSEIEKQKQLLQKVNTESNHSKVALGSVVITTQANYFIAISAGEYTIANSSYFAISAATPIAQLLLSKKIGDKVVFRENKFVITEVF
ncbi:GreA/GreB family elongation factor [Winogradskyella psychrotolerans]|uniref:GreA/GreB family elongation factor n=1 Tax=Winogradskyella psychrotolerans TaxID=1344585 RepID=UPI001C064A64|nr:GreA/GreB family elongation factor [Winogradskyella psychrotolerans]MBU2926655.1 GreA/GreB family elongation factor [Winogradskyella psychrotolerans]